MHVGVRLEQPRLQIPKGGADLVHHRRPILTDFARQPQQLDFTFERLLDQSDFVSRRRFACEQSVGNSRLKTKQRPARRFGGMRGEHWSDTELEHRLLDGVSADAEFAQLTHRPAC